MRARGAVRPNLHFLVGDLARHHLDARGVRSARARQPDVGCIDAEVIHQMKQLNLLFDRRFAYRGRLKAVAQGLIIKPNVTIGFL